jgi:hypothetical protein
MAIVNDVSVQNYNGSLLTTNLLSGNNVNLVLSALGSTSSTTVTENNNSLQVGETVALGDGRSATVLGSGTAQPGVNILGVTVPTGTKVPIVLLRSSTGQLIFLYPAGTPNLLSAVALVVNLRAVDYTFAGGIICFAAGTLIATENGNIPVENLTPGQRVQTRDDGAQVLEWIGQSHLDKIDLQFRPALRPIRIKAGALGDGMPARDLVVSPQHRILIRSAIALRMFAQKEVLVAAKHLVGLDGIAVATDIDDVTYYHVMCAKHQIIISEGAATESLYAGPEALKSVSPTARAELYALFPTLDDASPQPARLLVAGRQARRMAARHTQNRKLLFS